VELERDEAAIEQRHLAHELQADLHSAKAWAMWRCEHRWALLVLVSI
jgi:hypothetical protein